MKERKRESEREPASEDAKTKQREGGRNGERGRERETETERDTYRDRQQMERAAPALEDTTPRQRRKRGSRKGSGQRTRHESEKKASNFITVAFVPSEMKSHWKIAKRGFCTQDQTEQ